ncbi:hypothetical protein D1872_51280 [compost metagenome]
MGGKVDLQGRKETLMRLAEEVGVTLVFNKNWVTYEGEERWYTFDKMNMKLRGKLRTYARREAKGLPRKKPLKV